MKIRNILSMAVLAAVVGFSGAAHAADAFATHDLNLRAGPGKNYPIVAVIKGNPGVNVRGCTAGYKWCDISSHGAQGWVVGKYLAGESENHRYAYNTYGQRFGTPVVVFNQRSYWDANYKDRPFYGERKYWTTTTTTTTGRPAGYRDADHDGVNDYREADHGTKNNYLSDDRHHQNGQFDSDNWNQRSNYKDRYNN